MSIDEALNLLCNIIITLTGGTEVVAGVITGNQFRICTTFFFWIKLIQISIYSGMAPQNRGISLKFTCNKFSPWLYTYNVV